MSLIEIVAAGLGVLNILFLIRRSIWNYAFGLAMVALYAPIFFAHRLYSDALLQLFFFAVNLYGWWEWRRARGDEGTIVVRRLTLRGRLVWGAVATLAWLGWSTGMRSLTDAINPFWDGAVAAMSVTAQVMLARRLIENWPLWVAVDALAIALYWTRDLKLTAGLYALFLLLASWGWWEWARAPRVQEAAA